MAETTPAQDEEAIQRILEETRIRVRCLSAHIRENYKRGFEAGREAERQEQKEKRKK